MSESHEALRVRIEAALRERWPEASVTVSDEFHYGRRQSTAGAVWAKTVSVFTGAENRRGALELLADAVGLDVRERADYLEARRGALLDEIERLTARDRDADVVIEDLRKMLAAANADLAREMRERAAKACETVMDAQPRSSLGDVAMCCRAEVLSLPLTGEEVAPPKVCGFCNGRRMVAYGREIEDACEACCGEEVEAPQSEDRAPADDPLLDGTDGAHPAWWRGHDRAADMFAAQRDAAVARAETAERERDAARAALRDASRCEACGAWATRYHTASASYGCDSCGVGDGWADDTHAPALRAALERTP